MHQFLIDNRDEPIARCQHKVAHRPRRAATANQLEHQLARTLGAEEMGRDAESIRICGAAGGNALSLSEIGVSAAAHGRELMEPGFAVDQVVHGYGDLCQAITDLAFCPKAAPRRNVPAVGCVFSIRLPRYAWSELRLADEDAAPHHPQHHLFPGGSPC